MNPILASGLLVTAALLGGPAGAAEPPLKIGLIGPFSGSSYESGGAAFDQGIKAFLKIHGDTVAGRKVEIIRRDVPEPMPELAKRVATELVVRDKVDFLTGVIFTPNALAAGQVSGATKTPFVIMNAATSGIMAKIPNAVRVSFTMAQVTAPLGDWAAKNGSKRAFTIVADYAPGIDAENAFTRTFTEGGGQVVEKLRVPLSNVEFSPYVRRIRDAKADAVYLFLPNGDTAKSFLKAFKDGGLVDAKVKILADGGITAPNNLPIVGDNALGIISSHHYTETHATPVNERFVKAFAEVNNGALPTYISAGAYDAMAAIYKAVQEQNGKPTLDRTMEILGNLKMESPRGPIQLDARSRDITQNVYIRRVERRGGQLVNVEFETIPAVKP
ncbi:ABC transporter substrate-binding protein [Hydrogenophaga sp.]|jgi:branched-chain amino acid transport system substrate-binding protein|uniref:ABC transporter substrate-binding protein n=1 Tax=Hydrogenophaga sp. TaxID=1904254 RepID=UPI003F6F9AD2